jgi:copper(I)-binding protein
MSLNPSRTLLPLLLATSANAHVTLPPGGGAAGSVYPAAFRIGHACKDASLTTAIKVRLPTGFTLIEADPHANWVLTSNATEVTWTAASAQSGLPNGESTIFVVRGRLPDKPGPIWFKVLQVCDKGSADWAEIPARDGDKPAFPAARLDVLPPGVAAVDVHDAWARVSVVGQAASGAYAKLLAPAGARLVGGSTPAADRVEVHEMKMDGDVMRMRELERGLELPVNTAVELRPGGVHLMLMGLKQPLAAGNSVPLTLRFVDREGREGSQQVQVQVVASAPATSSSLPHH